METYLVVGGDVRNYYMAVYLKESGKNVYMYRTKFPSDVSITENSRKDDMPIVMDELARLEDISKEADEYCIVLPTPVLGKDGRVIGSDGGIDVEDIRYLITNSELLSGSKIPESVHKLCYEHDIEVYDFMTDDWIKNRNGVATAEGAILDAALMSSINIEGSKCLVTGYGACGKAICDRLKAWGADVTVLARRKESCTEAEEKGIASILLDDQYRKKPYDGFDFCFNTIPAMILDRQVLEKFSPDVIIIDIASMPGGTDFAFCDKVGLKYKHSLGIPGKYSPETAGRLLGEALMLKG